MIGKKTAANVALGSLMSVSLLACTMLEADDTASTSNMQERSVQGSTAAGGEVSSTDQQFMMQAAMGGMAEVATARLALEKSSNQAVKDYAQRMIQDHTQANTELMQIAESKGVTLPTQPDAKHQEMMQQMQNLSGAEFDKMYLQHAGLKDHKKMEDLFRQQANQGSDPALKTFAAKTLPVIESHLQMSQQLASAAGVVTPDSDRVMPSSAQ